MNFPTKQYDLGLKDMVTFRPYTCDEDIIRAILIDRSEYHLFVGCFPKVIFDVGANIGATSLLFANSYPDAKIFAFEPEPDNFKLLCANLKEYPNVKVFPYALGGRTETRKLSPSDDEYNLGGFSFHSEGINKDEAKTQTVEVRNVAEVLIDLGIEKIDLMKVDTEGCEYEILFRLYLDGHLPAYLMGEMHGVDDYKTFEFLSQSHDLQMKKSFAQRCYEFYAVRKPINGTI